jgi:hypothetical protein
MNNEQVATSVIAVAILAIFVVVITSYYAADLVYSAKVYKQDMKEIDERIAKAKENLLIAIEAYNNALKKATVEVKKVFDPELPRGKKPPTGGGWHTN